MTKKIRRSQKGFTLIELLTVIAIIGILASIIIPTVGQVQKNARRTVDAGNLKQIGQASLIFAQANKDQLPSNSLGTGTSFGQNVAGGTSATVKLVAGALAVSGGLDTAALWVSKADDTTNNEAANALVSTVLNQTRDGLETNFNGANLAFGYVVGLNNNYSATTPIAYTRGIIGSSTGKWSETTGTYKADGGHVVFIGGNVQFYKNLGSASAGELVGSNNAQTNRIENTVKSTKTNVRFLQEDNNGQNSSVSPAGS